MLHACAKISDKILLKGNGTLLATVDMFKDHKAIPSVNSAKSKAGSFTFKSIFLLNCALFYILQLWQVKLLRSKSDNNVRRCLFIINLKYKS